MQIHELSNELLIKASKGELGAFEEIYRASSVFVYNVALNVVMSREDAEEVTQEVFLKLFENLKSFKFKSSFKTWLYRVTVNTALNFRKKMSNHASSQVQYDENIDTKEVHENQVEKNIENKSNEETVKKMLEALSPEYRSCLVLREMQGRSNRKGRFRTIIALILNGKEFCFEGIANGIILESPKGKNGFGYDPIFQPEGYSLTFAEMNIDDKNKISHRATAINKLVRFLKTEINMNQ